MVEVEPPQLPEVVEVEPPQLPEVAEVELPQLPEVAEVELILVLLGSVGRPKTLRFRYL